MDDAIASGVSVWGHSTGSAPTPHSQATRRRAPRSAPVAPRGSGRSRRADPQRQTRPEARTHGQARLQAVVLGPEITPHSLWKLWVTRVCGERALHASGSGDEVAARLYAVAPGAPTTQTFGPTRPTGGRGRTQRSRLLVEAGAGRERLPHDARGVGERLPSPRLYTHCWQGHKTESRSAHTSQAVGAPGFEPGTSCPPDKRANQAAPRPVGALTVPKSWLSGRPAEPCDLLGGIASDASAGCATPRRSAHCTQELVKRHAPSERSLYPRAG